MRPGETYKVTIYSQAEEMAEAAPQYTFRRRTIRESRQLDQIDKQLADDILMPESEQADIMAPIIREYLVDGPDTELEDLHIAELAELFHAMRMGNHLNFEAKKNSSSPSTEDTESSAPAAESTSQTADQDMASGSSTSAQSATAPAATNAPTAASGSSTAAHLK